MSKRLEILENSLIKKNADVDNKIQGHFDTVKLANGQPLNDKRNGAATFKLWDKQNDSIRNSMKEIEITKAAIEREKSAIKRVENSEHPQAIQDAIDNGEITQWRKFPNRFFLVGVEKARMIWDKKTSKLLFSHFNELSKDDYAKFREYGLNIKAKIEQELVK